MGKCILIVGCDDLRLEYAEYNEFIYVLADMSKVSTELIEKNTFLLIVIFWKFSDDADETAEAAHELVITEEMLEKAEDTPFSVAGNGELLDDITNDETKQFLIVRTKNGNTFFMAIDRSRNSENVYMLSLIDEHNLAEFIEEEKSELVEEKPAVIVEEPQPEPEKGGMGMGAVFTILLLGAGCVGGYYYFRILKPKREEEEAESEGLEFDDGGVYVNEDQESGQEDEEE